MRSPSNNKSETYDFLNDLPEMEEWIGSRNLQQLTGFSFNVENVPFQAAVRVKLADIERDKLGLYTVRIQELGRLAKKHMDVRLKDRFVAAFTTPNIWDGTTFFSNSHKLGGYTNNNLVTTSVALGQAGYDEARKLLHSMVGINGRPIVTSDQYTLVCGPANIGAARRLLNAELVPSAAGTASESNIWRGDADILEIRELGTSLKWALFATGSSLLPWIVQIEKEPETNMVTNPDDGTVFDSGETKYGVDYRGEAAHGLYWLAVGSPGE